MLNSVGFGKSAVTLPVAILSAVESSRLGRLHRYKKGDVLYDEGDPVTSVFVIKSGHVKILGNSPEGRAQTRTILGEGRLVGAADHLLGVDRDSTAQVLADSDVYVVPVAEFDQLLASDGIFSAAVMKELAQYVRSLSSVVRELGMFNVQQRLRYSLQRLADEHGLLTERGVKIDLDLTHEELANLISANRSTITAYLNELKRQGYVWKEARRLVIIPPEHIVILDGLSQAILEADDRAAISWAQKSVEEGVSPFKTLDTLTAAIRQVDREFGRGRLALPDIVGAAYATKCAMPIVEEEIKKTGIHVETFATVVIGTARGDIHDIGKTIAGTLLTSAGFKVVDLGVNVNAAQFVAAVRLHNAEVLAMSALMSVTATEQGAVIQALNEEGLRDRVKVMVGGGGMTRQLAERIHADGYDPTAQGAVELALKLCARQRTT